jgi:MSHA biogenesis protein MshN
MSLINQMLKDLDKRRGPLNKSQLAALQGMGLINNTSLLKWHDSRSFTAWGITGLLAIVLSYPASIWWKKKLEPEPARTAQTISEAAEPEQHVQLETVTTQGEVYSAAPATADPAESVQQDLPVPVAPIAEQAPAVAQTPTVAQTPAETVIRPVKTLTPEQQAQHLYSKAQRALSSNRHKEGERLLRQALDENSRHIGARSQLATLLISRQQRGKAERVLAEGLVTDSQQFALARPYAQLLAEKGEHIPALATLDVAIAQRRADAETLALRAAILYKLDRHTASAAEYRKALQFHPQRALWWTGLAVALEQDGQSTQALEAFQRAAELPLDKPVENYVKQRIHILSNKDSNF